MEDFHGHANKFFHRMFNRIMQDGMKTNARGMDTYELLHQIVEMPDPSKRVLTLYNRAANPIFQMAETIWILAGKADVDWICHFNSQLANYVDGDNKQYFNAPYGERLRYYGRSSRYGVNVDNDKNTVDQIKMIINELSKDPGSRRAVAFIGNPLFDINDSKDRPCNIALSYKVRYGKLHATTFNRSNDMVLGLTYTNIVQFTTIMEVIAAVLGIQLGPYIHYSDSLHIYTSDKFAPKIDDRRFDVYDYVNPTPMKQTLGNYRVFEIIDMLAKPYEERRVVPTPKLECPYWQSAAHMIWAWDALKENRALSALESLLMVEAKDWRIASLEYLIRWIKNHEKSQIVIDEVHSRIKLELKKYGTEPEKWVFHGASNS